MLQLGQLRANALIVQRLNLSVHAEIKFGNMDSLGVTEDSLPFARVLFSGFYFLWRKLIIAINEALFECQQCACLSLSMHRMLAFSLSWVASAPELNPSEEEQFACSCSSSSKSKSTINLETRLIVAKLKINSKEAIDMISSHYRSKHVAEWFLKIEKTFQKRNWTKKIKFSGHNHMNTLNCS